MPRQFRTGDQSLVREINRSIILNQLRTGDRLSRADLAAITGLNKTTVSSLVDALIADGFVREAGPNASAGGRPAVLLELNPDAGGIIGIEIGVGYVNAVLIDFRATIQWRRQVQFAESDSQRRVIGQAISLIRQAMQYGQRRGEHLLGVGVAIPGLVDVTSGTLVYAPNLGWRDVPLRQALTARFNLPVFVDNDANAAALGERYFGAAQSADNLLYLAANVGLGIGIVLGGHLFQGASGYAGEAGHMTVDPNGPLCRCGNRGCWERVASQRALIERVEAALRSGHPSSLALAGEGPLTLPNILEAARGGDSVALEALQATGTCLGVGLASLVNIFNPTLIAFGGSLSQADEFLMPIMRQTIAERAMIGPREAGQLVVSVYKSEACVVGGAALVLHDILSRPRLDFAPGDRRTREGHIPSPHPAPLASRS